MSGVVMRDTDRVVENSITVFDCHFEASIGLMHFIGFVKNSEDWAG